ncbi:NACHT domain-containing protein [Plantactinospora sp. CA-294935]|uniref:NACHT domain-containing protein n=1 Tax=Plantactinospora sp. CA-294935 TaxID=3240012 RepID=UPI003D8B38A0
MSRRDRVQWQRYWRKLGSNGTQEEASAAHAVGLASQAGLVTTGEAAAARCAVLLAPPGAGKTYELESLVDGWTGARRISFGAPGDDGRLLRAIDDAVDALAPSTSSTGPLLALDSLDEASLGVSALTELIADIARRLPRNAHFVLACRSAGWLPSVEHVLRDRLDDVEMFALQPLTPDDIVLYATAAGVDGDAFLRALRDSGVADLAGSPHTLSQLMAEYRAAGDDGSSLPGGQRELFERTCRRLVTDSDSRRHPLRPADVDPLLAAARHMATLSLFSGRPYFTLSDVPGPVHLTRTDCAADVTAEQFATVLNTALFDTAGPERLAFYHQTVTEFLAAQHLIDTGLSLERLHPLLHGRGGRLAPQVQAVAAWLVALKPQYFGALLNHDPEAFLRSGVEIIDPTYRRVLVDRLLDLAQGHELLRIADLDVGGLRYDGLEERLRAVLADLSSSMDASYLAIRIARQTGLRSLNDVLVATALDVSRPVPTRNAAALASLDLVPPTGADALLTLAEPHLSADDPDDELFGVGLQARLAAGIPLPALLRQLRAPSNPDIIGNYWSFLQFDLPRKFHEGDLSTNDVRESLLWTAAIEPSRGAPQSGRKTLWGATDELCDAILIAGMRQLAEIEVRDAMAALVARRLRNLRPVLRRRQNAPLRLTDRVRRDLVSAIRNHDLQRHEVFGLARSGLVGRGDLTWLLADAMRAETVEAAQHWSAWLVLAYDPSAAEHRAALEQVPPNTPLYEAVVKGLLEPPSLPDDEVGSDDAPDAEESATPLTEADLKSHLTESLSLDASQAFHSFGYWAQFAPGPPFSRDHTTLRVVDLPGWSLAGQTLQNAALEAAQRYLEATQANGADLLGTQQYNTGAFSAARALVLLSELGEIPVLPNSRWRFLAPVLVRGPYVSQDDATLVLPLRWLYSKAREALLDATEREMRGRPEFAQFPLRRLRPILDPEAVPWLRQLITDPDTDAAAAAVACEILTNVNPKTAIGLLRDTDSSLGTDQRRHLGAALLTHDGPPSWPTIRELMAADRALAGDILGDIAEHREGLKRPLDEAATLELWQVMNELFAPASDPEVRGVHTVSRRESAANMRDGLLPALANRGTPEAVAALQRLADEHPSEASFRRLVALAKAAQARSDWQPLPPSEVSGLIKEYKSIPNREPFSLSLWDVSGLLVGVVAAALISAAIWGRDGFEVAQSWLFAAVVAALGIVGWSRSRLPGSLSGTPAKTVRRFLQPALFFVGATVLGLLVVWFVQSRDHVGAATASQPAGPTSPMSPSEPEPTASHQLTPPVQIAISSNETAPGSTLTIQGEGFWPGETVRIELTEGSGLTHFSGPYFPGDPTADADGILPPTALIIPEGICCSGATVRVHFTGRTSHRSADHVLTLR